MIKGTGATKLKPDFRDYQLRHVPGVAEQMTTMPDAYSLRHWQTGPCLDQGSEPSCAAFSTCHMQAMFESMERHVWLTFDGHLLYRENGGTGAAGVSSRDVLQDVQDRGAPVLNSPDRYRIGSYAFVDFSANFDLAIQTVKASVAAERPCVLAMLLPSDFGADCGKAGSTTMGPESYHQVLVAEYEHGRLAGPNSWSSAWSSDGGWYHVAIDFLQRPEQQGWLYAFTSIDRPDDNPPPPPPNPVLIEFDATVTKANANLVKLEPEMDASGLKGKRVHVKQIA